MSKTIPNQLSGVQFLKIVDGAIEERNAGIGRLSYTDVSKAAGLSETYLRMLADRERPNPTALTKRAILYVLEFEIDRPEDDVIPHLKRKGVL